MALSDEQLKKYQDIHREYYGEEISKQEAYDACIKLMRFVAVVYQPLTEAELASIQEYRKKTLKLWARELFQ